MSSPPEGESLRIVIFLKRRSDITEEQMYHHWEHVHAPLVVPWAVKHGFKKYTLLPTPMKSREEIYAVLQPPLHGTMDYEGMVELEVESLEKFTAACKDPYFVNVIKPDEINFLDSKSTEAIGASTMGISKKIVEGGHAMIDTSKVMSVWEEWERVSS
ncbi:hypothetical protein MMC07_006151 [Pseudocyphellaria aurata]|nr:hypothetical protein [Pseudocyphellaria aurata]